MSGHELAYVVLPAAVAAESAGVPLPGEATLVTAAVLAAHGHLEILPVVALAAAGAVAGDNLGYLLGRRLGRRALLARGPAGRLRRSALRAAASLFGRYGGAAVLVGRFVSVGRIAVAWLAGADEMPWRRFAIWNLAGSVAWAALVGGMAYAVGAAGAHWIAVAGVAVAAVALGHVWRASHRPLIEPGEPRSMSLEAELHTDLRTGAVAPRRVPASSHFDRFAEASAEYVSRGAFFAACVLLVVCWAPSYFALQNLDTWQLLINTATTIITFLLVALLQNTSRRSDRAIHHKLDALADGLADLMEHEVHGDAADLSRDIAELKDAVGLERTRGRCPTS